MSLFKFLRGEAVSLLLSAAAVFGEKPLYLQAGGKISVVLLTACALPTYLLIRKAVSYVASFKTVGRKPLADVVYLCLFFVFLFVPMTKINKADRSQQENRMLAPFPALFENGTLNTKFGEGFNSWFSDRFALRRNLIHLHARLKTFDRYVSNNKAFTGRDGWQFTATETRQKKFKPAELDAVRQGIEKYKAFCRENKIKCYIEIVPRKIDFAKNQIFKVKSPDVALTVIDAVKDVFPIVFPYDEMQKADEKDFVYFKTDHHWTEWGAYAGYRALMREMAKDFPALVPVSEDDYDVFYTDNVRAEVERKFWKGQTCKQLNLPEKKCVDPATKYKNYTFKNEKDVTSVLYRDADKIFKYPKAKNKLKAMLIGNSFTENFASFFAYTFRETKKIRCNTPRNDELALSRFKDELLDFKPDVLVFLFESLYTEKLTTLKD